MQSKSTFPARIAPFSVFLLCYRENGSGSGTEISSYIGGHFPKCKDSGREAAGEEEG